MLYNRSVRACVKFDCDRQSECGIEKVECKAFRYWVNNDSYWTMRKDKKTSIDIDMKKIIKGDRIGLTMTLTFSTIITDEKFTNKKETI